MLCCAVRVAVQATCEFCKDTYQFELEEVLAMIEETK